MRGLVLAETELEPNGDLHQLPPFPPADVTHDDRYSGGALAHASRQSSELLLIEAYRHMSR